MSVNVRFLLLISVLSRLFPSPSLAQIEVEVEMAFPNLSFVRPVDLQHPTDGSNRLFVVEQRGVISAFENDSGVTTKTVFLDIQDRVNSIGNEEGLLGLAFHPDYASNGHFYVNYTASNPRRTVIALYTVSATNPNVADKNSELVILEIAQPFSNHNGGQIVFGPDGYLYIGMGDGGSGGDPLGNGQNLKTLLGAMLRIDVNTRVANKNYGIPPDNPFAGNPNGFREEIYAYGLRNPWRFSFDPLTNWLWAADVGQNNYEEIDIIQSGKNYGWNVMEGLHCFNPRLGCDTRGLELPIWEYDHSLGASITGGFVYRGKNVPELMGAYIYADFVSGRLWALRYDGRNPAENRELLKTNLLIASFGVDANHELYICAFDGKIYRLKPTVAALPWDVNQDGVIDIFDLVLVASEFGQHGLNLRGDINGDGAVDIFDLVLVGGHFNKATNPAAPRVEIDLADLNANGKVRLLSSLKWWLLEATRVDDGSETFRRGIAVLESLLNQIVPQRTMLLPNYPNPFNPETWIPYELAEEAWVKIEIYSSTGRRTRTLELGLKPEGRYISRSKAAYWDGLTEQGEKAASGIYFYVLKANLFSATQKMILLK